MLIALLICAAHLLGISSAVHAVMSTRTSQGAIAWVLTLVSFPYIALPLYWIFGRSKFNGYVVLRRQVQSEISTDRQKISKKFEPFMVTSEVGGSAFAAARLAELPYLKGNAAELLINGQSTFASIFDGIDRAKNYILVQFYIVKNDEIGRALKDKLIGKAKAGVKVWFLYDELGSGGLKAYLRELRAGGVNARAFQTTRGARNRFQLNFRNHRKIVVVDGAEGWVGGHNVGDEYLGRSTKFPNWRDTHLRLSGPTVLELQLSFVEDWHWAANEVLALPWEPKADPVGQAIALILPSGPADVLETCSLMYQQAIHTAKQRVWIASPYFIPDEGVLSALYLAALRGVDVRILIPEKPDNLLVYYSAYAFLGNLLQQRIAVYRYQPGFLHEKVFLVDDRFTGISTANLDNRSFRLNFEVTALVVDECLTSDVEKMFLRDFSQSRQMTLSEVQQRPFWFRLLSRLAHLTAPIQ
jgi:cardiolipin synthase